MDGPLAALAGAPKKGVPSPPTQGPNAGGSIAGLLGLRLAGAGGGGPPTTTPPPPPPGASVDVSQLEARLLSRPSGGPPPPPTPQLSPPLVVGVGPPPPNRLMPTIGKPVQTSGPHAFLPVNHLQPGSQNPLPITVSVAPPGRPNAPPLVPSGGAPPPGRQLPTQPHELANLLARATGAHISVATPSGTFDAAPLTAPPNDASQRPLHAETGPPVEGLRVNNRHLTMLGAGQGAPVASGPLEREREFQRLQQELRMAQETAWQQQQEAERLAKDLLDRTSDAERLISALQGANAQLQEAQQQVRERDEQLVELRVRQAASDTVLRQQVQHITLLSNRIHEMEGRANQNVFGLDPSLQMAFNGGSGTATSLEQATRALGTLGLLPSDPLPPIQFGALTEDDVFSASVGGSSMGNPTRSAPGTQPLTAAQLRAAYLGQGSPDWGAARGSAAPVLSGGLAFLSSSGPALSLMGNLGRGPVSSQPSPSVSVAPNPDPAATVNWYSGAFEPPPPVGLDQLTAAFLRDTAAFR